MPKNKYDIALTEEMKAQLMQRVEDISVSGNNPLFLTKEEDVNIYKSVDNFWKMAQQNEPTNLKLLDSCMIGPTSMSVILIKSGINVAEMPPEKQPYYAAALEEMFGLSTKFKYDKKKNQFVAEREIDKDRKYGDVFTFKEEDLELGVWDKICAFFGYTTDHAERVNFIKESLKEQKGVLNEANKVLVYDKKNKYVEKHKELYERNKAVLQQAKDIEAEWKDAFFSEGIDFKDYKFDNGKKISALSACIAIYKKDYNENICDKNPGEIDSDTKRKMVAVATKYLKLQKMKEGMRVEAVNMSVADIHMTAAIGYKDKLEVDYDKKVTNLNEIKNSKLKDEARMVNNYVVLKMKAEMSRLFKGVKDYEPTQQEKDLAKVSVDLQIETNLYEDIQNDKLENIKPYLEKMHKGVDLGKDPSYGELLDIASTFAEAKLEQVKGEIVLAERVSNVNKDPELENDNEGLER